MRRIRRPDRDRIATWLINWIRRTVASHWLDGMIELEQQQRQAEAIHPELRAAVEDVLTEYAGRFADCDAEWPGVDSNLEQLAWVYRELTGWDTDARDGA